MKRILSIILLFLSISVTALAGSPGSPPYVLTAGKVVQSFNSGNCTGFLYSDESCKPASEIISAATAADLTFAPTAEISATDTQAAIVEAYAESVQTETDPVVGLVNGQVRGDGLGNISAASVTENVIDDYGAAGDGEYHLDGVATASDTTFTSAEMSCGNEDVGKVIIIPGVAANALNLQTTIASCNSTTSAELTVAPTLAKTSAEYVMGTDDTAAFQAFFDSLTRANFDGRMFKLHPTKWLNVPSGRIFVLGSGITATQKDDAVITGGGTIVFGDIKAFHLTSCRRITFKGLHWDGMTYNQPNTAPTDSTAIYLDQTDTTFDKRSRAIHVVENRARRMKHFVTGSATWNGVELIIRNNHLIGYDVKDSIGINITNFSDNEISGTAINGFQTPVRLSENAVATIVSEFHPYSDYGVIDTPLVGDTTLSDNTVSGILDTSNIQVGRKYSISAGFPSSTYYYTVASKTASTIDLVDDAGASVVATSSETDIAIQNHTADYMLDIEAKNVTVINNELDHGKIANIRVKDPSNVTIVDNIFFRTVFPTAYFVYFDPAAGSTPLDGVVVRNNNFLASSGLALTPFYYSANVDLASSVDTELGPNNYGEVTTRDDRWYVNPDHILDDGTNSTTWANVLASGSWEAQAGGIFYDGGNVDVKGATNNERFRSTSYGAGHTPAFVGRYARGTEGGGELYPQGEEVLLNLTGQGWKEAATAGFVGQSKISMIADATWSSGSYPTRIEFHNTPTGSGTIEINMTLEDDGTLTLPNGVYAGTGNRFVCMDATEKIYVSATVCTP